MTKSVSKKQDDDIVLPWAEIIGDMLRHIPAENRLAVLAKAVESEQASQREPVIQSSAGFIKDWDQRPGIRYRHDIMRFESMVAYSFIRRIISSHSKQDAARVLFAEHRGNRVPGSGWLPEYLDGLPAVKIDLKKAAAIQRACTSSRG
jgi:hypothetical protein